MFFYVSKILGIPTMPSNALFLLALLGAVLLWTRWRRAGRIIATVAVGLIILLGATPLPKLLARGLEDRFPQWRADGGKVDGIIVLGGTIGLTRGQVVFDEGGARVIHAVDLAKRYPEARLVFSGGTGSLLKLTDDTEADAAKRLFATVGLPPDGITFENRSRNTHENAKFTRETIGARPGERWLLVTSAFHMPRAVGCFRGAGLDVVAAPADFRTYHDFRDFTPAREFVESLALGDLAIREYLGLIAYRLAGYTDAFFPGP